MVQRIAANAPWSGRHVMDSELERLLACTPARLIAVVGPHNAGKTALLTSFFLQLANGQRHGLPYRFASSRTLFSWQSLAKKAKEWSGSSQDEIVAHTPNTLVQAQHLHVGLRPASLTDDRHVDVLFSDLPGEWISEWVRLADEQNTQRLRFFARCDAFVQVLDAAELVENRRKYDAQQARITERLIDLERTSETKRPLLLVLSKWDRVLGAFGIPPETHTLSETDWPALANAMPRTWRRLVEAQSLGMSCVLFAVSAFPHALAHGQPVGVMAPFRWLMQQVDPRRGWSRLQAPVPVQASSFEALRRWEDTP